MSDNSVAAGEHSNANHNGHHHGHPSGTSDTAQVWMLSLQMQALALAIEDLRARVTRIEQHLRLHRHDDRVRSELSKLERIW